MIKIYTDGSCLNNPGDGGWAAIIISNEKISKISGHEKNTTNNKMELIAPINALKKINLLIEGKKKDEVIVNKLSVVYSPDFSESNSS